MRQLVKEKGLGWTIDSAGTGGWHAGEAPDTRAQKMARQFGVDISGLRARQFSSDDFDNFDHIFALDQNNYRDILQKARTEEDKQKVRLLMNVVNPGMNQVVPDPWYDDSLFEPVFKMIEEACTKILNEKC